MTNNNLILKQQNNFFKSNNNLSYLSFFYKHYFFLGEYSRNFNKFMLYHISFLKNKFVILNINKMFFMLKNINYLLKKFSYKNIKFNSFFFFFEKYLINQYFLKNFNWNIHKIVYLDLNKSILTEILLNYSVYKPRFLIVFNNRQTHIISKFASFFNIPLISIVDFKYTSKDYNTFVIPWNLQNTYAVNFFFEFFLYNFKHDKYNYFIKNFLKKK